MSPKDEIFAKALADGKTAPIAYQEAGYVGGAANARRKKAHPAIKQRVSEILAQREQAVIEATGIMAAQIVYTRETVIAGLFDTIERAKAKGDLGTMRAAYVDLGREIGMFVERSVNLNVNADLDSLADSELLTILESEGVPLALAPPAGSAKSH